MQLICACVKQLTCFCASPESMLIRMHPYSTFCGDVSTGVKRLGVCGMVQFGAVGLCAYQQKSDRVSVPVC